MIVATVGVAALLAPLIPTALEDDAIVIAVTQPAAPIAVLQTILTVALMVAVVVR
jgi:hypothetical protein